jgi:radical SAM-linked protein
LSTADYSAISPLVHSAMKELRKERATLSVSSLRAYGLDEDVLDEIKDGGGKGLTFAPEAGTQRMRDVINKNVTEEQLLETARRVFSRGFSRMTLYFMIGLPTETDEDVLGIVETGARAQAVGRELIGRAARVTVSVSTHVPKPHTPFQWCAMDERDEVLRKQQMLRDAARRAGVELRMHDSLGSFLEGVIARGDRSLCEVIYGAFKRGARFDSWEEQLKLEYWQEAMEEAGVSPSTFLGTIPTSAKLPWDHIDVSLAPGFLAREYRKALRDRLSPPCGKAVGMFVHHTNLEEHERDQRKLVCYHCGVACDMQKMRTDRADFLIKLGAKQKPSVEVLPLTAAEAASSEAAVPEVASADIAAAEEVPTDAAPPPRKPRPPRAKPPERPDQGRAMRVRLGYRKVGRAAFSSHLDLVRLLPRLFRRLDLPVYYSLGFHSKPVLVFGPALSLGVASLAEYVDLKLCERDDIDWSELPGRLSEATIDGIEFFRARRLRDGEPKLSALINEASYVAGIPLAALPELGFANADALRDRVAARSGGELRTRRLIDGIGKWVDVHQYLREVAVDDGAAALEEAGIAGDLLPLRFRLEITDQGTAKASEVLETLLDAREVPARIVRTSLGWRAGAAHGTPFDIERYATTAASSVTIGAECVTEVGS